MGFFYSFPTLGGSEPSFNKGGWVRLVRGGLYNPLLMFQLALATVETCRTGLQTPSGKDKKGLDYFLNKPDPFFKPISSGFDTRSIPWLKNDLIGHAGSGVDFFAVFSQFVIQNPSIGRSSRLCNAQQSV